MASRPCQCIRTGLTIIELMVSGVIASILMTGILGVAASIYKQKERMSGLSNSLNNRKAVFRLIEFDLSNSRVMTFTGETLELAGYASKNEIGEVTHAPCRVTYSLHELGNKPFLIRKQVDVSGVGLDRVDIVSYNVDGIDFLEFEEKTNKWQSLIWQKEQGKRMSVPDVIRVQLFKNAQAAPFFDEVFCLNALRKSK